jgi:hypothetical protein
LRIFRESLTALAALLALALVALAVVPHFLTWNHYRTEIAGWLGEQLGQPVSLGGDVRITLLPTPEIDADQVEIGPPERPLITAGRVTVSLQLLALARGNIQVSAARADRVVLRDELLNEPAFVPSRANRGREIGVDRLDIRGLTWLEAGSDRVRAQGLDLGIEAPILAGPHRFEVIDRAQGREFRGQTGRFENGRARLRATIEDHQRATRASLDGWVGLPGDGARPLYDGSIQFNGNPVIGPMLDGAQIPFDGQARVILVANQAIIDPLNVTIGPRERSVSLSGQLFLDFAQARPVARLALQSRRIDLAPYLSDTPEAERTRDRLQETARALRTLAAGGDIRTPFDLEAELIVQALQAGASQVQDVRLGFRQDESGFALTQMDARLPGSSQLTFRRRDAPGKPVDGPVSLEIGDMATFLQAFAIEPDPRIPAKATVKADLSSDLARYQFDSLRIASDGAELAGSARLELPQAGQRAGLALQFDLGAEAFDARLLGLADPLRAGGALMDIGGTLRIRQLRLDQQPIGGLALTFAREGGQTRLDELRLTGRRGEELRLSGQAGQGRVQATAKLDAERLEDVSAIAAAIFPGPVTEWVRRRAGVLAPAIAVANIRIEAREGDSVWDIQSEGRLGATELQVVTHSEFRGDQLMLTLRGEAKNSEAGRLLAQIGGANPAESVRGGLRGPGQVRLQLEGNPRRNLRTQLQAGLGGLDIAAEGTMNPFRAAPFDGRFNLQTVDLAPLHRALGNGAPALAEGTPARIEGRYFAEPTKLTLTGFSAEIGANRVQGEISFDFARAGKVAGQLKMGELSLATLLSPAIPPGPGGSSGLPPPREAWRAGTPPLLAGDLWIEAKRLALPDGLSLDDPKFVLRFAPGLAAIEGLEAERGPTRWSAHLNLMRDAARLQLAGRIGFARLAFGDGMARLSGEIPLTGEGTSWGELVASLAGAGRLTLEGASIAEADAAGFARQIQALLSENGPWDENRLGASLVQAMRGARLDLPGQTVSVSIVNGIARMQPSPFRQVTGAGVVEIVPSVTVDLPRQSVEARLAYRALEPPKGWRGAHPEIALAWQGRAGLPLGELRRNLQVAPLLNGLLAITLQRDLETIEAFDADQRERQRFIRRSRGDSILERNRQLPAPAPPAPTISAPTPEAEVGPASLP